VGLIADTNSLSDLADGDLAVQDLVVQLGPVAIPAVVLGEDRFGLAQSRHRESQERWLLNLLSRFRVLDVTGETALWYAEIRLELKAAGTPIPANDLWIAALCRQHNLPLLSRDRHFDLVAGLRRISW
jgi:predicted nucleic acid-binding protein